MMPLQQMNVSEPTRVTVHLAERSYDIVVGSNLLAQASEFIAPALHQPRVIIVADADVAALHLKSLKASLLTHGVKVEVIEVKGGEGSKSFATLEWLVDEILALTPDRKTTLIALGGGVIGDLVGFTASIVLRGVDFIQIPTTLLAMVDSSVGGKTGINTKGGKNLVGSFHQPKLVLADMNTLATLPDREMRAGYAEVVKYGLLGDAKFFEWLEKNGGHVLSRETAALAQCVAHCCQMKAQIVARDEFESGMRALLNLGHTFGHALEAECGFSGQLLHGEAVAIGMVMACRLSAKLKMLGDDVELRVVALQKAAGLPTHPKDIRRDWNIDALCSHFAHDKKAEYGELVFILLKALGEAVVVKNVAPDAARAVVQEFVG